MGKATKDSLVELLQDLYNIRTRVNQKEIAAKQMEALGMLKQLKLSYSEGYSLLRKYSHSDKEFNVVMQYARPVLIGG